MNPMPTENAPGADNQQETLEFLYFTGFCCGEISFSLLRLSNRKSNKGGVYYTPDITVSNADLALLKEVNLVIAENCGIISKVKGAYNLSFRGKIKVKKVLSFFAKYPPIAGDLFQSRYVLIIRAIKILEAGKSYRRSIQKQKLLEKIRTQFSQVKKTAVPISSFPQKTFDKNKIGYFLSGVFDAEGSVGLKTNGNRKQPFFAIAMKDVKIVELFKSFIGFGNIHPRPKEKMIHFEIGAKKEVLFALQMFSENYPSKLAKVRRKIERLKRILNDYTLEPH
jgi:hypothetical protein